MKSSNAFEKLFLGIGILVILVSGVIYKVRKNQVDRSIITQGHVVDIQETINTGGGTISKVYAPIVEFQTKKDETIKFTANFRSSHSKYKIGDQVELYYSPENPKNAVINRPVNLWAVPAAFLAAGILFSLIGGGMLLFPWLRAKKIERLKLSGKLVSAKILKIEIDKTVKFNGMHPYKIFAEWIHPYGNKSSILKSENIWFDPTDQVKEDTISVWVDMENPKNHYMDTTFLKDHGEI